MPVTVRPEFWSTSAQTLPVLALAQVIEARALASRFKNQWGNAERFLIIWWSIPLAIYAVTTPICFMALLERPISERWANVVLWGITSGVSFLVANPALSFFVAANSRTIARGVGVINRVWFSSEVRRLRKENAAQIQHVKNQRDGFKVDVEQFGRVIDESAHVLSIDESGLGKKAKQHLARGRELVASSTALYDELLDQRDAIDAFAKKRTQSRKVMSEELGELIRRAALLSQTVDEIDKVKDATEKPAPEKQSDS